MLFCVIICAEVLTCSERCGASVKILGEKKLRGWSSSVGEERLTMEEAKKKPAREKKAKSKSKNARSVTPK